MDGRYEEARLETKAATLAERLFVEWPLQASLEASPPLPRAQLPARFVTAGSQQALMSEILGYKLCFSLSLQVAVCLKRPFTAGSKRVHFLPGVETLRFFWLA